MSHMRRLSSEKVGAFRVFDVLKHRMLDPEGRAHDAFTFVCPDWVSIVPITDDGRFVFVRQYRHGIDDFTLEVPGGVIEPGQTPADAAMRELREEAGYGDGTLVSLGWTFANPALQNNRHHMFLLRGARRLGEQELGEGEYCDLVLLEEAEVRRGLRDGTITHALVLLALARAFELLNAGPGARQ